jgi:hypothetical protein
MVGWDPSLPQVILLRKDGEMASGQVQYVDDIHPIDRGHSDAPARAAGRQLRSRMNSVGNQADDRKFCFPTTTPGAWKGDILHTDMPFPRKSTTGKRWS